MEVLVKSRSNIFVRKSRQTWVWGGGIWLITSSYQPSKLAFTDLPSFLDSFDCSCLVYCTAGVLNPLPVCLCLRCDMFQLNFIQYKEWKLNGRVEEKHSWKCIWILNLKLFYLHPVTVRAMGHSDIKVELYCFSWLCRDTMLFQTHMWGIEIC